MFLTARRQAEPRRQMALTGATFADQDHRLVTLDVAALRQFANLRSWNLRRLRKVKLFQRLHPWQL